MTDRSRCVLVGAGGHAKVLIEALRAREPHIDLCLVRKPGPDDRPSLLGVPVVGDGGDDGALARLKQEGVRWFVIAVGSVGDSQPRARLFEQALAAGLEPLTVQHPTAIVSPSAQLSPGCQLLAGAIVAAEAQIGANAIVNNRAVVEHDCRVGEHAHVATGAVLAGGVIVGAAAHVGAGAVVRQGLRIGPGAVVGVGAAVVRDVPPGETVVGVPARRLRAGAGFATPPRKKAR